MAFGQTPRCAPIPGAVPQATVNMAFGQTPRCAPIPGAVPQATVMLAFGQPSAVFRTGAVPQATVIMAFGQTFSPSGTLRAEPSDLVLSSRVDKIESGR